MGPTADRAAPPLTVREAITLAHTHWNAGQAAQAEDLACGCWTRFRTSLTRGICSA